MSVRYHVRTERLTKITEEWDLRADHKLTPSQIRDWFRDANVTNNGGSAHLADAILLRSRDPRDDEPVPTEIRIIEQDDHPLGKGADPVP